MTISRSARWYRAALRLTPRAHRDRFGTQQMQLYDDLVRNGVRPWRLWLGLPGDVLRTRVWTRPRPVAVLQPAGGPAVSMGRVAEFRRRLLPTLASMAQLLWLGGHLTAGLCWFRAVRRLAVVVGHTPGPADWTTARASGADAAFASLAGRAEALTPWLVLTLPFVVATWAWLPRRGWFALAWGILWPLGMVLLWGFGGYLLD